MSFLKNYTSGVPVSQTIARIESVLIRCGVKGITKEYLPNGTVEAIHFHIEMPTSRVATIRMPAKVEEAQEALWLNYVGTDRLSPDGHKMEWNSYKKKSRSDFAEQAARTAWKIVQDWIEVQMSMIQMKQADTLEVFMPFLWDGNRHQTYYQALKDKGFAGLLPQNSES